MKFNHDISKLKDVITSAQHIVILTHYNPDGDAIGSSTAWLHYLQTIGKQVRFVVPNDFPQNLKWINGSETAVIGNQKLEEAKKIISEADLMICNDFQSFSRIDVLEEQALKAKAFKILVDHHIEPDTEQFDLIFSFTNISSTSELTFDLITQLSPDKSPFNRYAAEAIYTGIMTDTGSFSFSCNHKRPFEIVAELIDLGIDTRRIHQNIYDTFSESRLRLLGCCLTERMVVLPELATAYMFLTQDDLKKYNYITGDTEGIVNYALSMKGIKFAAFFTERENRIRISFRSKDDIDCNEFAKTYFNGGGHRNASGGNSFVSLQETIKNFEELLPEFKQKNKF